MELSLLGFVVLVVLAGVCGAIAKSIVGMHRGGLIATVGLGFVGGLVGVWLANAMGAPSLLSISLGGTVFPFVWALLGTIIVVAAVAFVTRQRLIA